MLTWYVADLKTGLFVEELPLKADSLERTIGTKSTCTVNLDVLDPSCPPNWTNLVDGRRSMIVPVNDDLPLCGYLVTDAVPGSETVPLTLESIEAVPEYVNVEDAEFDETVDDEADIMAALFSQKITAGWGFELAVTKTGRKATQSYSGLEDRTVASAVSDLASKASGPEWITRIRWEDGTHRRFIKTIEIGPQVGREIQSTVIENMHLESRRRPRSWQKKAVRTIATGDGAGESRPMSTPVVDDVAIAAGVPPWELRVAATSIETDDDLDRVALQASIQYRYGTQRWELEIAQTEQSAPKIVRDYDIGDTVRLDLDPTEVDPAEYHGAARVIGWRATVQGGVLTNATPAFWAPDEGNVA